MIEKREDVRGRALLVGVACPGLMDFDNSDADTMAELAELVKTAGGETVLTAMQNRHSPDPRTFIGEGKCAELKQMISDNQIDLVIFDNELSPSQGRALEEALSCRVIDRNALILDIFADRASTAEGKLQVELAQYQYLLPRLTGMWSHLVRQTAAGGSSPIGTRGPGETQLETDRRHIRRKIQKLTEDLTAVRRVRATQRSRREKTEIPLICIIGYTNAGKSTLLNALTGADVHAADRLFDTLDPTTKLLHTDLLGDVLISDTVGFIRKLPHHLVDAFRATLEELSYADVLVHVIDASDENWRLQAEVVEKLANELGAAETPRIVVFNKCDKLRDDRLPRETDALYCSALRGVGLDALIERICQVLGQRLRQVAFLLPYDAAQTLDLLYRDANVKKTEYMPEGIAVEAIVDERTYGRIRDFLPEGENGTL
ncbi:MAG: GTPase HflX [Clostridiaceae bacterium]|nr:GTPase HflX [Clostridiaceae bacterium]